MLKRFRSRSAHEEPGAPRRGAKRIGLSFGVVAAIATTAVLAGALSSGAHAPKPAKTDPSPDLILYNGKITTEDPSNPEVKAISIRDGEIVAVGDDGPIKATADKKFTTMIDLKGRRVIPGMIDSHIHALRMGYHCWTQDVRLDLVTSRAQALQMYKDKAASLPAGKWIWTESGGWSLQQLDNPTIFTFDELSAAAPNNPVWVTGGGVSGPRVNQAALTALGLSAGSPGVEVGADGKPTGRLTGAASTAANAAILAQLNAMSIDDTAACLRNFITDANMRGLTGWVDAVGNTAPWGTDGSINSSWADEALTQLYRDGNLHARVAYHDMSNAYAAGALAHSLAAHENSVGFVGDDWVRYLGPGEDFMATQGPDYVTYTKFMAQKRLSVETHVGGPIDAILDGMEAADKVYPVGVLKWRIAHPSAITQTQLDRAKALGVGWALTFSAVRTGQPQAPYRDVMNDSAHMCLGTDAFNVAAWAPFQMIWMVTTGHTLLRDASGVPVSGVPENERLTRAQALEHYTADCAWFMDQDGRLGQLTPGYHADLSVLSDDYFSVPDDAIKDLTSVLTVVGGEVAYSDGTLQPKLK
jgi:predicted amidohydrolase YtcJ